jgi:uncharacterized protein (TIGR02099 family)
MQLSNQRTAARTLLGLLEFLALAAFFAFAAVFFALRFWLLPQIDRYQDDVVAALSRAVGLPVKIGSLRADWDGLHPRLTVTNLRIYDRNGREALVLPSVEPLVGWTTLLARELRLYSLTIDGPRLTVRRGVDGHLSVAGITLGANGGASAGSGGGNSRLTDWILGQREIIVRDAEVEWVDELRGAPALRLRRMQFRMRNRGEVHQIGLSARPPGELGAGVELRASLVGRSVTRPAAWNGRIYVELGYTDLAGWRAWFDYPIELTSGQGALRLWATFGAGKLVDATADLALAGVVTRLGHDLPELRVASVSGRVQGRETARGYEFGARRLDLVPEEGPAMHGATFRATWDAAPPGHGSLNAALIELEPLARLADYLPFPADLRSLLAELAPQGKISDASFEWSGKLPDEARYRARARFDALGMSAWRKVPGFANLSGHIDASETQGVLAVDSLDADLALPRIFVEPSIRLARLSGEVRWSRRPGGLNLHIGSLKFANEDLAGSASGSYDFSGDGPGSIDLFAQLERADARGLNRYLPRPGVMGEITRKWLVDSIQAGKSSDTRLRLRGDLRDFPFADPRQGQFEIAARVHDGVLRYAEGWPPVEDIECQLLFVGARMDIVARRARMLDADLSDARAGIADLRGPRVLAISGQAEGPTETFLEFIRRSPLRQSLGAFAGAVHTAGRGNLRIKLQLPLAELAKSEVSGQFAFAGNTLHVLPPLPPIERAAGTLAFTESSAQLRNASATFLGGPLRVIGGTQSGGGVVLNAGGRFTTNALGPLLGEPWQGRLQGAAGYTGSLRITRDAGLQVALESNLDGVAIDLPPPLAKAAPEAQLLRVALLEGDAGARDRISVTLGQLLRAEVLRQLEGGRMVADRAAIAFNPLPGERPRLPERPTRTLLYGTLQELDLDRWLALLSHVAGGAEAGSTAVQMSFGALDAFGKRLRDISVDARLHGGWSASVKSATISGDVQYSGGSDPLLTARMARFDVPENTPGAEPARPARDLPDLDLVAEDFGYHGRRLGRVEMFANHEGTDWQVDRLAMKNTDGSLTGKALWHTAPVSATTLSFEMESGDAGRFLERLGYPNLVRGGKASAKGALAWNGEPMSIDYASLSGTLQLHAEQGQFLKIEPGIGKLISLISLQNIGRRLVFDFSDVFSKGFQWDVIDAHASIAQGVMETKDFKMSGSAAEVGMQGKVDLANETQDLRVRVVPALDSTASTAAAVAVNPIVGLSSLILQKVLKNPLGQIFAFEYAITGGWADPKVEKLAQVPLQEPARTPAGD